MVYILAYIGVVVVVEEKVIAFVITYVCYSKSKLSLSNIFLVYCLNPVISGWNGVSVTMHILHDVSFGIPGGNMNTCRCTV